VKTRSSHENAEGVGSGVIVAFLILLGICAGAFGAASQDVFKDAAPARITLAPGRLEGTFGTELQARTVLAQPPSSMAAAGKAAPACNVERCSQTYARFRSSDCTFQPYDGSRRLCRK
jgi:hypothetical protein